MFDIQPDPAARRLTITVRGFWTDEVMSRYEREMRSAYAKTKTWNGTTSALIDASEFPVQPAEIIVRMDALLTELQSLLPDWVAFVAPAALVKSQIERVNSSKASRYGTFTSRADAEAWLASRTSEAA